MAASYGECKKNFVASFGGYETDGCQEYLPDERNPGSYQCSVCGCHRNFHHKVEKVDIDAGGGGNNFVLSSDESNVGDQNNAILVEHPNARPSTRSHFTDHQKERMTRFATQLGWLMPRTPAQKQEVINFCEEIGVSRNSFRMWMSNKRNRV
ncbi:hypothetical protein J5N97_015146 [Dioscorea zingiberensis]|uniref:ZF-HD dimerization-type domain-containing protein n=1 Tax=Dioscorea zingiberensis TaxID=325984 RepID=A0A9D5CVA5_9LILI|nr:hypothetical protein J5N97_015146 [Dioscorea zingiberensis]